MCFVRIRIRIQNLPPIFTANASHTTLDGMLLKQAQGERTWDAKNVCKCDRKIFISWLNGKTEADIKLSSFEITIELTKARPVQNRVGYERTSYN